MLKLLWKREKSHCDLPCAKRPLLDFSNLRKTLVAILFKIRIHVLLQATKSQSRRKIWEKHKMQENLCPIFQNWLKTLAEFSQLRKSKKVIEIKKDLSASNEKCLITVRQGMWYMRVGLIEKWVKDLKSARTGFTGTFKFYTEKSYNLLILFSLSQLLICQNLSTNGKSKADEMRIWIWAVARIRIPVGESGSSKKKANWIEKCSLKWEFKKGQWFRIPVGVSGPNNG